MFRCFFRFIFRCSPPVHFVSSSSPVHLPTSFPNLFPMVFPASFSLQGDPVLLIQAFCSVKFNSAGDRQTWYEPQFAWNYVFLHIFTKLSLSARTCVFFEDAFCLICPFPLGTTFFVQEVVWLIYRFSPRITAIFKTIFCFPLAKRGGGKGAKAGKRWGKRGADSEGGRRERGGDREGGKLSRLTRN